jgi:hypothetical protein
MVYGESAPDVSDRFAVDRSADGYEVSGVHRLTVRSTV